MWIIEHRCSILNVVKVSDTKINLVCALCKKIVGTGDPRLPVPTNAKYLSEEERDSLI
jgi:hypothetical protein